MRHVCIVSVLFLVAGCSLSARRLEVPAVAKIKVGATTRNEVEKLFGRPNEAVAGSNDKTVARYFFRELHVSRDVSASQRREHPGDILFRTLSLRYGTNRVVEQKLHDESFTPIYWHNGWNVAGPSIAPENLLFIQKDKTTAADLIDHLGEPTCRTFDSTGVETLIWFSVKARRDRLRDAEVQRLVALMDERRVVKDYAVITHDFASVSGNFR
jgi:hypothetical protein